MVEGPASFDTLGISPELLRTLESLGYEEPTPIQRMAIPPLLEGRDLLGQAATGTGKTAAFAIPMLQRLADETGGGGRSGVRALVLVPTRELAIQVAEAVHRYGRELGVQVLPVYGGQDFQSQLRVLRRGVDVVVATPGRALDHIRRNTLDLSNVRMVVLDEADEMLDMGFAEDLEAILAAVPAERQTALFSATIAPRIAKLSEKHLRNPKKITIERERVAAGEIPRVRQLVYMVQRRDKITALGRVLDMENAKSAIIFCRTRTEVDEVAEKLGGHGYAAEALHGGMTQEQRSRVMKRFRDGTCELLVATDVAARGLDIEHVSHVVNFDVPAAPDAYVHRIGRTGRAGREGTAVTLAEPRERAMLRNIERLTGRTMTVEPVPTVMDLRARRIGIVSAAVRDAVVVGELAQYVIELSSLAGDYDLMDIAAAAMKVAHDSLLGHVDETEIARVTAEPERERPGKREGYKKAGKGKKYEKPDRERPAARFDKKPDRKFGKKFDKKFDKKADKKTGYPKREASRRGQRPR
ncbi:DEAD/DEAH box helicase [soil metagenome]